MTARAIRLRDFHRQRVADQAPRGLHQVPDSARDGVYRHDKPCDDDSLRWSIRSRMVIDVKCQAGVASQNLDVADAGNKRVADNFQLDQRRLLGTSHSNPLQPAEGQQTTYVRNRTELFSVSKWNPEASYTCKQGITRASIGMLCILQPQERAA